MTFASPLPLMKALPPVCSARIFIVVWLELRSMSLVMRDEF